MEQNSKKALIIPIVSIIVFLMLVFSAAYAYFESETNLNTANYELGLPQTTTLVCSKTDCVTTVTPAMMLDTNTSNTTAKRSSTCRLNCTCTGSEGAKCNYNVTLLERGMIYYPSAGVDATHKEFTFNVTSPTGCTAQGGAGTANNVNNFKDKVVSKCSLTVPANGVRYANMVMYFKWFNLDIPQDTYTDVYFNYDITSENVQIIYRQTEDIAAIGDNISVLTSGYYTDTTNLTRDNYLKHIVKDGIITESYACIKFIQNSMNKEVCMMGGNADLNEMRLKACTGYVPGTSWCLLANSDYVTNGEWPTSYDSSAGWICEVKSTGSRCYEI